ncbi:MAG TPA: hypothetical protein VK861_05710, partial [Bacteroidales bacterium]|nr:hypothetical protein [Bacteroidales bacterium]
LSFPLLSPYGSGIREILRKALLLPFVVFPEVLAVVALNILPYVLTIYLFGIFPRVMMFWGFIGFSILVYYSSIIMNRIHMKIT